MMSSPKDCVFRLSWVCLRAGLFFGVINEIDDSEEITLMNQI